MSKFSHTDHHGKANMVDVGKKPNQLRIAKAQGHIKLKPATLRLIRENDVVKGDVLSIAQFAGIQAAKQTSSLIPLCHPLLLSKVDVACKPVRDGVRVTSVVKCTGQTGVEMEALTAVSIALLTIYDMCKAVDKTMVIGNVELLEKTKQDLK